MLQVRTSDILWPKHIPDRTSAEPEDLKYIYSKIFNHIPKMKRRGPRKPRTLMPSQGFLLRSLSSFMSCPVAAGVRVSELA